MNLLNNIVTPRKGIADHGINFFAFGTEGNKILIQKLKFGGGGKIVKISPDKLRLSNDADKFIVRREWTYDGKPKYRVLSH